MAKEKRLVCKISFCQSFALRTSALPTALWFWISKMPSKLRKNIMPRRFAPRQHLSISLNVKLGGEGGIRTHGRLASTTVFKTVLLNRSSTSPFLFFPFLFFPFFFSPFFFFPFFFFFTLFLFLLFSPLSFLLIPFFSPPFLF